MLLSYSIAFSISNKHSETALGLAEIVSSFAEEHESDLLRDLTRPQLLHVDLHVDQHDFWSRQYLHHIVKQTDTRTEVVPLFEVVLAVKYLGGMKLSPTNQARMTEGTGCDLVDAPLYVPKMLFIYTHATDVVVRVTVVVLCFIKKYQLHARTSVRPNTYSTA